MEDTMVKLEIRHMQNDSLILSDKPVKAIDVHPDGTIWYYLSDDTFELVGEIQFASPWANARIRLHGIEYKDQGGLQLSIKSIPD
jgi:hypothetical protein